MPPYFSATVAMEVRPMPEPVASREIYAITKAGRNAELARSMAAVLAEEFRTSLAPKMRKAAPWVAPYLHAAGEHAGERVPVFPEAGGAPSEDVYVL